LAGTVHMMCTFLSRGNQCARVPNNYLSLCGGLKNERLFLRHGNTAYTNQAQRLCTKEAVLTASRAHLKKFMALARVSGGEPGGDFEMGAARAKWPLNIMQIE